MNGISPVDVEREAERIYRAIFRAPLREPIGSRFRLAVEQLNQRVDQTELENYYRVIREANDLEALEIAGRITRSIPSLSVRFLLMVYIAETVPENQHYFVNLRPNTFRGWWALGVGGFSTSIKLLKGLLLMKRHRYA